MAAIATDVRAWLSSVTELEEGAGEMYNAGAAVSEEALRAYQAARTQDRVWRALEILPEALAPEIRQRFFFYEDSIQFEIGFEAYGRVAELFRFAGRAMFKGLEKSGGIGIWELITAGPVLDMIDLHHAAAWMKG